MQPALMSQYGAPVIWRGQISQEPVFIRKKLMWGDVGSALFLEVEAPNWGEKGVKRENPPNELEGACPRKRLQFRDLSRKKPLRWVEGGGVAAPYAFFI